jgi:hypothetical protein
MILPRFGERSIDGPVALLATNVLHLRFFPVESWRQKRRQLKDNLAEVD